MKRLSPLSIAAMLAFCASANASITYSFVNITNNDPLNAAAGQEQLFVELDDTLSNEATFTFSNTGLENSSITQVYFDDGGFLSFDSLDDSAAGVEFSQGASPPELPGGNNLLPAFMTTDSLSFGSEPPTQPNGVNPGEWLAITFGVNPLVNLQEHVASGALRIGIHVQGFGNGGSEAFILGGPVDITNMSIPAPGSIMLAGIGIALIGLMSRQQAFQPAQE